jgi:elongation factor Ts
MSNTDLIKELRALTQAGMKDCKESLEEANWDLQKAVDLIKTKGLNIVSGREGKVATEGLVGILNTEFATPVQIMAEVNCQTDFVANNPNFLQFVNNVLLGINSAFQDGRMFDVASVETERVALVTTTKENIVVRRWWVEEGMDPKVLVFPYLHSNKKIGVLLTLQAPSIEVAADPVFKELGFDLAMQIAAMNPLAISVDTLSPADVERQRAIFEAQLVELKKPQAAWPKILDGKFNKWYTEMCLLNQESVLQAKTTVQQVIKKVSDQLGGEVKVVNFIRCQVGEGLEKQETNLAEEVAKMM